MKVKDYLGLKDKDIVDKLKGKKVRVQFKDGAEKDVEIKNFLYAAESNDLTRTIASIVTAEGKELDLDDDIIGFYK